MHEIVGLPAIVTARHRIVIDKNLRTLFGIPETGPIQLLTTKDFLQIFPVTSLVSGSILKHISIGRFNLPIEWARSAGVQIGGRVFLTASADCIMVRPSVSPCGGTAGKEAID